MDALQILAGLLLVGRLISVRFLSKTLIIQKDLLKLPIDEAVWDFRKKLNYMTFALLIGNIPSIVLDLVVLFGVDRTTPFLIVYAIFNMTTMVIASIMIHKMYQLAGNTKEVNDLEIKHMESVKQRK